MSEQVTTVRLPGVGDDVNDVVRGLLKQLHDQTPRNQKLASYYDMHRRVTQVSNVLPAMYSNLALCLGWTAKGVDSLARRCRLTGFSWPDGDLASLGYAEVWDGNMLGTETRQAGVESLIHGPAFSIATVGGSGEPPAMIHFKSALDATGEWDGRARRLRNLLSVTGRDTEGNITAFALYLPGRTVTAEKAEGKWRVSDDSEHAWGMPAEPMVYKPRLRRPFGSSRISRPARSLQNQAIRELLRLEGHMDVFSFPELMVLGADASVFKDADGNPLDVWSARMARIKGIPDDIDREGDPNARADVKQFSAASPDPHLAVLNALAKLFAREVSLPDSALAITDVSNPTSAESYDASQYELIAEAEGTVDDWSPSLRRTFTRALMITNGETTMPRSWESIDTRWRNPRFLSRAAEADAGVKQLSAVPWLADTRVGLELAGLTEQQIKDVLGERLRVQARERVDALIGAGRATLEAETPDGVVG